MIYYPMEACVLVQFCLLFAKFFITLETLAMTISEDQWKKFRYPIITWRAKVMQLRHSLGVSWGSKCIFHAQGTFYCSELLHTWGDLLWGPFYVVLHPFAKFPKRMKQHRMYVILDAMWNSDFTPIVTPIIPSLWMNVLCLRKFAKIGRPVPKGVVYKSMF